jgi:antitoxin component YwqK of YwqJK toxin-antitoxin module
MKRKEKKMKKHKRMLLVGITVLIIVMIAILGICKINNQKREVNEKLKLASEYLANEEYEKMLIVYQEVIELKPNNVEANIGIAEVFILTNKFDDALHVLESKYEEDKNALYKEKIDMIKSGNIEDVNGRIMQKSFFDENSDLDYYEIYEYNENNQVFSVIQYTSDNQILGFFEYIYEDKITTLHSYDLNHVLLTKKITNEENFSSVEEYSKEGELVKYTEYNAEGVEIGTFPKTDYNENGNLCEYDVYGKLIREIILDENDIVSCIKEYNDNSQVIKSTFYKEDGSVADEYPKEEYDSVGRLCEYDVNGNVIKKTIFDAVGNVSKIYTYTYDLGENLILEERHRPDGAQELRIEYTYSGNVLTGSVKYLESGKVVSFPQEKMINGILHEYDANGDLVKTTSYNADGTIAEYNITEYNGVNGNVSTTTTYLADGTMQWQAKFEYDASGNLTNSTYYFRDEEDASVSN